MFLSLHLNPIPFTFIQTSQARLTYHRPSHQKSKHIKTSDVSVHALAMSLTDEGLARIRHSGIERDQINHSINLYEWKRD